MLFASDMLDLQMRFQSVATSRKELFFDREDMISTRFASNQSKLESRSNGCICLLTQICVIAPTRVL